jgi:hypothetical protein
MNAADMNAMESATPDAKPDGNPDVGAKSDAQPDASESDSQLSDARDAMSDRNESGSSCPATEPASNTDCPQTGLVCSYGDAGAACACRTISAGVHQWLCVGQDAGAQANCPQMKPTDGSACSDAGATAACRYGNTWCFCNETGGTANEWHCL